MRKIKCKSCHEPITDPKDYYMVSCEVWNKYAGGKSIQHKDGSWSEKRPSGEMHIACLEKAMGRKLKKEDLMPVALNLLNPYTKGILKK